MPNLHMRQVAAELKTQQAAKQYPARSELRLRPYNRESGTDAICSNRIRRRKPTLPQRRDFYDSRSEINQFIWKQADGDGLGRFAIKTNVGALG